jgi:hypothetical protein
MAILTVSAGFYFVTRPCQGWQFGLEAELESERRKEISVDCKTVMTSNTSAITWDKFVPLFQPE